MKDNFDSIVVKSCSLLSKLAYDKMSCTTVFLSLFISNWILKSKSDLGSEKDTKLVDLITFYVIPTTDAPFSFRKDAWVLGSCIYFSHERSSMGIYADEREAFQANSTAVQSLKRRAWKQTKKNYITSWIYQSKQPTTQRSAGSHKKANVTSYWR